MTVAASTTRGRAKRLVQEWFVIREGLERTKKHPLERIRELALLAKPDRSPPTRRPVTMLDADGKEKTFYVAGGFVTAAGDQSMSSRTPGIPINITTVAQDEAMWIMRHLSILDLRYWETLALWAEGYTLEDQARARKHAKATIYRWYEGGLAVVMSAITTRVFRDYVTNELKRHG